MFSSGQLQRSIKFGLALQLNSQTPATSVVDANTESSWQMCAAAEDMTGLDQLGVYISAMTGTPNVELALQGVNATTGAPDGSDVIDTAPGTVTGGAWNWIATTTTFTWGKGVNRYIGLRDGAGGNDLGASHNVTIRGLDFISSRFPPGIPGPGTTLNASDKFFFAARNSSTGKMVGLPFSSLAEITWTSGANNIIGQKFVAPLSGTPVGCRLSCLPNTANQTFRVGIYDTSGAAVCESETIEEDWGNNLTTGGWSGIFMFATQAALSSGTTYYLGMKSVSAHSPKLMVVQVADNTHLDVLPGGKACVRSGWNGSVWADTDTESVQYGEIYFGSITAASGGGGLRIAGHGGLAA